MECGVVRIDFAAEDDIDRILEIERGAISPPWTHGALLSEIYREDSFFAVAKNNSQFTIHNSQLFTRDVCGFVFLRRIADEGELLQIAVDRTARRRGVAGLLMDAAFRYVGEHALKSVFLEVRASNEAAIALYEKHGFRPVRQRKDYYDKPIEDAVVMSKALEQVQST